MSKRLIPEYFTFKESGQWIKYEGEGFTKEELKLARNPDFFIKGRDLTNSVFLTTSSLHVNYVVHSLAFGDFKLGLGNFPRWDEVNGWTTPMPTETKPKKDDKKDILDELNRKIHNIKYRQRDRGADLIIYLGQKEIAYIHRNYGTGVIHRDLLLGYEYVLVKTDSHLAVYVKGN